MNSQREESWGTRIGLILAMAGNAVGLGNFLRYPVKAVENGGGAFLIPYLVCFLLLGIPLLWMEWAMGRLGGRSGKHSPPLILQTLGKYKFWKYFGVFGIFTNIGVAAYYCYIEAWTLSYAFHSLFQTFHNKTQAQIQNFFSEYLSIFSNQGGFYAEALVMYLVCIALNTWVLSRGLNKGIEKVAKIAMPLLLAFGTLLALRGYTLGKAGSCPDCNAMLGINYLWEPQLGKLTDPKVWLEAAGQIFFTLAVGMGTIHCYAAYLKPKDDIALNAMAAGWMNIFVEIILGTAIVVPIAAGYLGLDWVRENISFSIAFQTMPYLFNQWGAVIATLSGFMWFGLLFFAGITSSLAMGMPWLSFMEDEYNWSRQKAAFSFGFLVLLMGLPTVLFFEKGVFDEYDYWAGTVSLVIFALGETLLFAWFLGVEKGWQELQEGADIHVPRFYKYIFRYITPSILIVVFLASLFTPKANNWESFLQGNWELDEKSIIGKLFHKSIVANRSYYSAYPEAEIEGIISKVNVQGKNVTIIISRSHNSNVARADSLKIQKVYHFENVRRVLVKEGA
ncbi:MAG: sodium-dependent transporter, partial [Bacteroidia bacterium]|nr:sodium-dependent transporter [Bacteroidia bacterium]